MPFEPENDSLCDLVENKLATLLVNRQGTKIYGNAFIYCYQRLNSHTVQIDVTLDLINDVFGVLNGFKPLVKSWKPLLHRVTDLDLFNSVIAYGADPNVTDKDGIFPSISH